MDATIEHLTHASFGRRRERGHHGDRLLGRLVRAVPGDGAAIRARRAAPPPQYRFAKVDVDAEPELATRYAIRSIPTLMVPRDGQPVAAQAGLPAEALVEALDRLTAAGAEMAGAREAA